MHTAPITQLLFSSTQLQDVDTETLQQLVNKHPYFSVARFLLLKKLQHQNSTNAPAELDITTLHFNNPQWMHWLLQQPDELEIKTKHITEKIGFTNESHIATDEEMTVTELVNNTNLPEEPAIEEALVPFTIKLNLPKFENPSKDAVNKSTETIIQPQDEPLAFEPYHTIDYFASQGIKLSAKIEPNDQLGKQLKSFTDWLKVMRKLPESAVEKLGDDAGNEKIAAMAQHSIEAKEVITESMAEVLAKQGMTEKAIDIYQKLSLLNPAKTHYFATKIQDLKQ